ncbi:MAG: TerD family protein [Gomphosphaeria aponina SAG 52.96 = DSM 107014]|uniref:TerD family protein n=1 Tax=Gomphosphaeria aponina SAG 52.96 = DSM 107014 TaxID=1521640 RepID=A0A941GSD7_9CHRO|nr:TerD family protein [Gomphosphaeria aponina SAG 52.96 = DSM 107014]
MAINLQKGQRISLEKEAPGLTRIMCGLGWDVAKSYGGLFSFFSATKDFDLDASVICLNDQEKINNNADLIYFGNLRHASGAITHLGDNLTGEGDGDDEQIIVDLSNIPSRISKLVFVVNIYNCFERQQDFGQVKNAFVRLVNLANNREIARFNLSGTEYQRQTGLIMAEIYRHNNNWKMAAIGKGMEVKSLKEVLENYDKVS